METRFMEAKETIYMIIPKELKDNIKKLAKKNDVSMTSYIVEVLENHIKGNPENIDNTSRLKMYTIEDIQEFLGGANHMTVRKLIKSGELPGKVICGKWRVSEANLLKYVEDFDNIH